MSNILKPTIHKNTLLSAILPTNAAKNALILDLNAAIVRASNADEYLASAKHNHASKGHRVRKDIKALAQ